MVPLTQLLACAKRSLRTEYAACRGQRTLSNPGPPGIATKKKDLLVIAVVHQIIIRCSLVYQGPKRFSIEAASTMEFAVL